MSTGITEETLDVLVNLVYEAAYNSARWPEFLRAFACAVESRGTLIYAHNFESGAASTASGDAFPNALVDFDPAFVSSLEYYNHVNVWAENESMLKPGLAVTGSMLYPERKLPKTEFYQDWLRPQDYFHAVGGVVVQDGPWAMKFSSLRGRRAGDFNTDQVRLYKTLIPHLARAARIHRRLSFLQCLSTASLAVLDTVPAAVMLLDCTSRTLHNNALAEAEFRRRDPFRLSVSGEIQVQGPPRTQAALRSAICSAVNPTVAAREQLPTVAQVARRNGEVLSVQALPLPKNKRAKNDGKIARGLAACALVIHGVTSRIPTVGPQLLRHVYGLTPAEVQVAIAIAEGETLNQYAERRGITRNTATSQLKCAFDKTGLKRQSELVRWLLLSGTAAISATSR